MDAPELDVSPLRGVRAGPALALILVLSAAVFSFLVWLIYFKPAAGRELEWIGYLPAVNALFNSVSAAFLVAAYVAVRRRRYQLHMTLVLCALVSSTLFLASYVVYHHFQGDTKFMGRGLIRSIYFFILITHITLSAVAVPLILTSLYLSLSGRLAMHRKVSRFTLPIWLYVSVTGVAIFVMLRLANA